MKTNTLHSLIAAAMNLADTAMQMSGAELYHYNMRGTLLSTKRTLEEVYLAWLGYDDIVEKIPAIELMIDSCLEEEGIAQAEIMAEYCGEYHNTPEREAYEDKIVAMADYGELPF